MSKELPVELNVKTEIVYSESILERNKSVRKIKRKLNHNQRLSVATRIITVCVITETI